MTPRTDDPSTWRLETPGGIKYKVEERSGEFTWESADAVEKIVIQSNDLKAFVRECFPRPVEIDGLPLWIAKGFSSELPLPVKKISWTAKTPGRPVDPFSDDNASDLPPRTYGELLELTLTFNDSLESQDNREVDPNDPETFLEISADAAGEFLYVAPVQAVWRDTPAAEKAKDILSGGMGGIPEDYIIPAPGGEGGQDAAQDEPNTGQEGYTVIVPETEWTLNWPRIDRVWFGEIMIHRLRQAMGKVNRYPYAPLMNAAPETLCLLGWSIQEERQYLFINERQQGIPLAPPIRLTVKIVERRVEEGRNIYGWQHLFRPGEGWQRFLVGTDKRPLFKSYDFNRLFSPRLKDELRGTKDRPEGTPPTDPDLNQGDQQGN